MKKRLLLLMLALFMTFSASAIEAPAINISLLNQDPDPVDPGQYVDVRFRVYNTVPDTIAKNFEIMLDPSFPFSVDTDTRTSLGDIVAVGSANAQILKFKVRVDDDAVEGINKLRVKYRHDGIDWISREFEIDVRTLDANLAIISVRTEPEKIKPGEEAKLMVTVKNMADSTLRDVTLKLDLTFSSFLGRVATITATDSIAAFNSLPFAPIGGATEQRIYSLSPDREMTFTYNLIAYSDADARVYKVPLLITYSDDVGTSYSKEDIIGFVVGSQPDISVVVDEADLYVGKRSGTVTIRFINKGFSDVKFLDVFLNDTEEYEILSASEVYIGNVDSDDYETAEFSLYLTNGAAMQEKGIKLPIHINYRDANNNVYEENYPLELQLYSPSKLGIAQSSPLPMIIILLVIGVGAFLFLRRRRRK